MHLTFFGNGPVAVNHQSDIGGNGGVNSNNGTCLGENSLDAYNSILSQPERPQSRQKCMIGIKGGKG